MNIFQGSNVATPCRAMMQKIILNLGERTKKTQHVNLASYKSISSLTTSLAFVEQKKAILQESIMTENTVLTWVKPKLPFLIPYANFHQLNPLPVMELFLNIVCSSQNII